MLGSRSSSDCSVTSQIVNRLIHTTERSGRTRESVVVQTPAYDPLIASRLADNSICQVPGRRVGRPSACYGTCCELYVRTYSAAWSSRPWSHPHIALLGFFWTVLCNDTSQINSDLDRAAECNIVWGSKILYCPTRTLVRHVCNRPKILTHVGIDQHSHNSIFIMSNAMPTPQTSRHRTNQHHNLEDAGPRPTPTSSEARNSFRCGSR